VKKRDLERHLAARGCQLLRQAAKHDLLVNEGTGQRTTVPRHREIKMPTTRRDLPAARSAATARRLADPSETVSRTP
jgi:predicted RNA binding protein YcfA (HicA-like mRNA interferase family)